GRPLVAPPSARRPLSASYDRSLRLWDLETGQELRSPDGPDCRSTAVVVTPDGRRALSASDDRTLRLWDLETGQELRRLEGHEGWVTTVVVTPDSQRALSASADRTLRLWDLETGQIIARFHGDATFRGCCFAPDGRTIIAGDALGRVHFLRLEEGKPDTTS